MIFRAKISKLKRQDISQTCEIENIWSFSTRLPCSKVALNLDNFRVILQRFLFLRCFCSDQLCLLVFSVSRVLTWREKVLRISDLCCDHFIKTNFKKLFKVCRFTWNWHRRCIILFDITFQGDTYNSISDIYCI